jgi:hypothetical protein
MTNQTLLYNIDPEDGGLIVLPASSVDHLTAEAKAIAFLWDATWSRIRWGRDKLSPEVREWVDSKVEWVLHCEWTDLHSDEVPFPERPADWLPAEGDAGFSEDWRESQGNPINAQNGLPAEIVRLGHGPGRPGAGDWLFFEADQLDELRAVADGLGLELVQDEVAVMRCWAGVWTGEDPASDRYVDDDWRDFYAALMRHE